jgi:hypothetical protein
MLVAGRSSVSSAGTARAARRDERYHTFQDLEQIKPP